MKTLPIKLSIFILITGSASAHGGDWREHARRLFDEADSKSAVQELKKIKGLESEVADALKSKERAESELALAVVRALEMKSVIPELIKRASLDRTGAVLLTLFALDRQVKDAAFADLIRKLWSAEEKLALTHKLILVRNGPSGLLPMEDARFDAWLASPSYELRAALATRAVSEVVEGKAKTDQLKRLLMSNPYQVRWELIAGLAGRKDLPSPAVSEVLRRCAEEKHDEVLKACAAFKRKAGDPR